MIRSTAAVFAVAALIAGCDRPPAEPRPQASAAPRFDNAAAPQSIMQPEVIAENPPEPTSTATPTPEPPRIVMIAFASGAALDADARAALDRLVADLPATTGLILRGHSDSVGSDAANLRESRLRAKAVRDHLVSRGIDAARIEVVALGERRPVAPNAKLDGSDDPVGRARNRRVEIELVPMPRAEEEPVPTRLPTATIR